ncbi:MAG: membrane integrity-associated transporter subunit PqiC [Candidatus Hydrogenedentes bacterium]|nr:membrane integrity-associated transporter subunit PqiC [Candidatus Hydrogenedentota bacterium]
MKRVWVLLGLVAFSGCVTAKPPRYYTLDMRPSGTVAPPCKVVFERLAPAESLARREILIKKSPTEIEYYALDRWAADLGELVLEKLASELAKPRDLSKTLVVSGTILSFEQVDISSGAEAHIKLALDFRAPNASRHQAPAFAKVYELNTPMSSATPADASLALSQGLVRLAAEIATDLERL